MFALDSLYAHYAGICFEKDSCYGCIKNTQSCILSGLKKKINLKLNLERSLLEGLPAWVIQLKKNSLAVVPRKQHKCVLRLCHLRYRILLPLSSTMLKFII